MSWRFSATMRRMSPNTSVCLLPVAPYAFASIRIRGSSLEGIAKSVFSVLVPRAAVKRQRVA